MAENRYFPIQIDGNIVKVTDADISKRHIQTMLQGVHRQDKTFCRCNPQSLVRLVVRLYGSGTSSQRYGLSKWPETGLDHDPDCVFFGEDAGKGSDKESKPAFEELDNGMHRAYLATALKIIERNVEAIKAKATSDTPKSTRQRATEVTLLLNLWRKAKLNVYRGKPRRWFNTTFALINAAKQIVINKEGETLSDYLLIGAGNGDKLANAHNQRVLDSASGKFTRLFVIGRLREFSRDKQKMMLSFLDFQGLPRISVKLDQLDNFLSTRPFYTNLLQNKTGNVIAIACIEPTKTEWWNTVNISGIATSSNMLPAESSFEIEFEEHLTSNDRTFLKPLILDETHDDVKRPDFILLDTTPRAYVEVWGMQTQAYLADKARRIANYSSKGQLLISWNANPREPFPLLPPIQFSRSDLQK